MFVKPKSEKIIVPPHIFNPVYLPLLQRNERYIVLMGGAGSGKSMFAGQMVLFRWLLQNRTRERILLIRKIAKTIRISQFQLFKDLAWMYGIYDRLKFKETTLEIESLDTGNKIISAGIDDPEKIKSIQGVTKIWIEEATELRESDFTQLDLRMRGRFNTSTYQFVMSFNPIDEHHWLNSVFFVGRKPDSVLLKTTYRHNKFIDSHYESVLQGIRDPNLRKIYLEGKWGVLKNIIYQPIQIIDEWPAWDRFENIFCGLDFGFNNQMAMVVVGEKDQEYSIKEMIYETEMTTADLVERLKQLKISKSWKIFCDSASPEKIKTLNLAGYNAHPAFKDVSMGIDLVKGLIDAGKLFSYAGNDNLHKERQSYKWEEDKNGRVLDSPVKFNDHLMDALRYAIASYLKSVGAIGIVGWKKK